MKISRQACVLASMIAIVVYAFASTLAALEWSTDSRSVCGEASRSAFHVRGASAAIAAARTAAADSIPAAPLPLRAEHQHADAASAAESAQLAAAQAEAACTVAPLATRGPSDGAAGAVHLAPGAIDVVYT